MKEKALKYTIILLIIPLTASLLIAILTNNIDNSSKSKINSINGRIPSYDKTYMQEVKSTDTYVYTSIFTLFAISGFVLYYVKKKKGI